MYFFQLALNVIKLPGPISRIEKLPMIKTIVVRRVSLGKIGRCERGHLVTIDRVAHKEILDLIGDLKQQTLGTNH